MSFIKREQDRISIALRKTPQGIRYDQLYAAQQALCWAVEPAGFKSPYQMIMQEGADVLGAIQCISVVFCRPHVFYTVALQSTVDTPWKDFIQEVMAHVEANPGTTKVETLEGEILWQAVKETV